MIKDTAALLREHYGQDAVVVTRSPGRVNLIGEHTDYNDGFVLPCAIDCYTEVSVSLSNDKQNCILAADFDGEDCYELSAARPAKTDGWADYVRGMVWLLIERFGVPDQGFQMVISGNVPTGAGLSSSASLEIAVGSALCRLYGWTISGEDLALLAQRAENEFVGCRCGIMDQFISALGEKNSALLIDCRSLAHEAVPMPEALAVMVLDSKIKRGLVGSEYNLRREQCERAAQALGVKALRDADMAQLDAHRDQLDEVDYRRARHVITENARTLNMRGALRHHDVAQISKLMAESHASMRDDFEITVPAIDALVSLVDGVIGEQGGVRMTGGGFGGCVVALVPLHLVDDVRAVIAREYPKHSGGIDAEVHVFHAVEGGHVALA
ncbi:galactokinase [Cardiobacteriaceae bacterium TAE3-ERU3]|nr:galactokinase [Cardiobacteriaceae bacterium TAE3-ERU3]